MTRPDLDASYAACRQVVHRAGSNFGPCFWILSRSKRRAMEALYAFLRQTDDLADNPQPAADRRATLARWRAALDEALRACETAGTGSERTGRNAEAPRGGEMPVPIFSNTAVPGAALLPALADTVRRYQIPREHLEAVIDGVEMDLDDRRYETFEELAEYCRRVASAVGLACIYIWGFRGDKALEPASQCGVAFQITNILRDLGEDARQGRIYLPLEDFRQCGYRAEELLRGAADERFHRLMQIQIDRAQQLYREGLGLMPYLEPDGRRIFGMMVEVYHGLLHKIRRDPGAVLHRRIRLSGWQKLAIAARWTLWPRRQWPLQ